MPHPLTLTILGIYKFSIWLLLPYYRVCDERPERGGAELAALLKSIPPERLMIETDAPYLVPRTIKPNKARPGRNEPALLPWVLKTVAQSLGEAEAEVARRSTAVACNFFGIQL